MALPIFTYQVAFGLAPFANPLSTDWVDLADHVTQASVRRGRSTETDQAQTGTGTLTLNDMDRRFDPENISSPYYPDVKPMAQLRIQATLTGSTFDVFRGWVDTQNGWVRTEDDPGSSVVTVPANDGFDVLGARLLNFDHATGAFLGPGADFAQEPTGTRIGNILANANVGWPSWLLDLATGQENIAAAVAADNATTQALQLIRDAEATEPGFFFFASDGKATFHDRHTRLLAPYTTSQAVFFDAYSTAYATSEGGYYGSLKSRQSQILNDIRVNASGLTEQLAQDAASIGAYRTRTQSYSTRHVDESRALLQAQWRLNRTKDSYTRYEELTFKPGTDTALWNQALVRELGDRITVVHIPEGQSTVVVKDCHIESINLDIGPNVDATCTWRLSPAEQTGYWLAGTAGFSEAGTTTKAAY